MKKLFAGFLICLFLLGNAGIAFCANKRGTAAEAEAMVIKAITYIKANGRDKGFAEISNPKGRFVDRDLYVTVYDMTGKCVAHGANQKMVGKNLIELKDSDGKAFVKERVDLAKTKDKYWQNYKFIDPITKNIEPKSMYLERMGDIIVGCGIYKQ